MRKDDKAWIWTFTGRKFYLLRPSAKDIDIRDIAHALSMQCRWTGHSRFHYSIAQHSYYCSLLVPSEYALDALMHDATEAYMGDMNRPLKHFTPAGPIFRRQEAVVHAAIAAKFGLSFAELAVVKIADDEMLYLEKDTILTGKPKWNMKWGTGNKAAIKIVPWTPKEAEKKFLKRFEQLRSL